MSSALFAITDRPSPSSSCIPAASLAPPVPPARTTQRSIPLTVATRLRPEVALGQPRDPDPAVRLVAPVDADQQGRQRFDDPSRLQRSGVDRAEPVDQPDQLGDALLVGLAVAAEENVLVEWAIAGQGRRRHGV